MISLSLKNIVTLMGIAFLLMGFYALYSMPVDGAMTHCPFMGDLPVFCQMTLTQHIDLWHQMFAITKVKELFILPLWLATMIVLFLFAGRAYLHKLTSQPFYRYLYDHAPEMKVFNRMLLAFFRGIIHPKIYA